MMSGICRERREIRLPKRILSLEGVKESRARVCPTVRTIVFPCKLLYEFLILVELLQVVTGHGVGAMVLCAVDVVLIAKDTVGREHTVRKIRWVGSNYSTHQMLTLGLGTLGSRIVPELLS